MEQATIALRQGHHKLIYYFGYGDLEEKYELYNLDEDPEERVNLIGTEPELGERLKNVLVKQWERVNKGDS